MLAKRSAVKVNAYIPQAALRLGPGFGVLRVKTLSPDTAGQPGYTVWCGRLRDPGSLAGMIKQAGAVPTGWMPDGSCHAGDFPAAGVWLERGDNQSPGMRWIVLTISRRSTPKLNGTGERNFGCSRVGTTGAPIPANQSMGCCLAATISTRPLTVFTWCSICVTTHSAVNSNQPVLPNSSPILTEPPFTQPHVARIGTAVACVSSGG